MIIQEAGIAFGGKNYPKNGNVLILAGGSGSGKGYALSKILLFNGKLFDVDELKTQTLKLIKKSDKFSETMNSKFRKFFDKVLSGEIKTNEETFNYIKNNYNECIKLKLQDITMDNPMLTSLLHFFIYKDLKLDGNHKNLFFNNLKNLKNKPNVIFDITLRDTAALALIYNYVINIAGYDPKNIHLAWVLNDIEISKINNTNRGRTVPDSIVNMSHKGASMMMRKIMNEYNSPIGNTKDEFNNVIDTHGAKISDLIQGDIWIIPNQGNIDNFVEEFSLSDPSEYLKQMIKNKAENEYDIPVRDRSYKPFILKAFRKYQIKKQGEKIKTLEEIEKEGVFIFKNYIKQHLNLKDYFNKPIDISKKINKYTKDNTWKS